MGFNMKASGFLGAITSRLDAFLETCSIRSLSLLRLLCRFLLCFLFASFIIFPVVTPFVMVSGFIIFQIMDRARIAESVVSEKLISGRLETLTASMSPRIRQLYKDTSAASKAALFDEWLPVKTLFFFRLTQPITIALSLIAMMSVCVELLFPNVLPWNISGSSSSNVFLALLCAALIPAVLGYLAQIRAVQRENYANEIVAMRFVEIILCRPADISEETYLEQNLDRTVFYRSLFDAKNKLRSVENVMKNISETLERRGKDQHHVLEKTNKPS